MKTNGTITSWEQVIDTNDIIIDKKTRRDIRIAEKQPYVIRKVSTNNDWDLLCREQTGYAYDNLKRKVFDGDIITRVRCAIKVLKGRKALLTERIKDYDSYRDNGYISYVASLEDKIVGGIVIKVEGNAGVLWKIFSDKRYIGIAALLIKRVCELEKDNLTQLSLNVGVNADKHLLKQDNISDIVRFKQHFGIAVVGLYEC